MTSEDVLSLYTSNRLCKGIKSLITSFDGKIVTNPTSEIIYFYYQDPEDEKNYKDYKIAPGETFKLK